MSENKMVVFNVSKDDFTDIENGKKWFLVVDRPQARIDINDIAVINSHLNSVSKLITCIDTLGMTKGNVIIGFGMKD